MTLAHELRLALTLARRDLRGGMAGVGVFLACLVLGVAAVCGVQSLAACLAAGVAADAANLLGGDLEIRQTHIPASPEQLALLERAGTVSHVVTLRAMASAPAPQGSGGRPRRVLAALKAVDGAYPLYGAARLDPPLSLAEALAKKDGEYGAVADRMALSRLGLAVGDQVFVADGRYRLRAVLEAEPDRGVGLAEMGPRLTVSLDSLAQTGLLAPGSLTVHRHRARLAPGLSPADLANALRQAFPDAPWRIREVSASAPGLSRFLDRLTGVLSLVGLTALLLGGLGVSQAVRGHLESKTPVLAAMKCLGAPGRLLFATFLLQVLFLAACATTLGLILGALAPFVLSPLLADLLPVRLIAALSPRALGLSAAFGMLTALFFSLAPLSSARAASPLILFRGYAAPDAPKPGRIALTGLVLCGLALAGLAALAVGDAVLALGFAGACLAAFVLLRLAALVLTRLLRRLPKPRGAVVRLALTSLYRPGSQAKSVAASLGLGLTAVAGMALVDANFQDRLRREIPERAPSFFFLDIQPGQIEALRQTVEAIPGVARLDAAPTIRGRFAKINGRPTEEASPTDDTAWASRGDRALTFAAEPPKDAALAAGAWWPQGYAGPPLVSVDEEIAKGYGLKIGDELTFNVLGREVAARVASLRRIDWLSLGMNYVFVLSPGALNGLPLTYLASLDVAGRAGDPDNAAETAVFDAVTAAFPNVSVLSVGEVLTEVMAIADKIAAAVAGAAGAALLAGILVLAQTLRAALARKTYETVIFKVCGASRRDVLLLLLLENALLGLVAGLAALVLGAALSAFFVSRYLHFSWTFFPAPALAVILAAMAAALGVSLGGVWRVLGRKPLPYLRNE